MCPIICTMPLSISIHALLAESDLYTLTRCASHRLFLSTLSLRRATYVSYNMYNATKHFYPRSPCGERRYPFRYFGRNCKFLSTLSLRRATVDEIPYQRQIYHFYPRSPCGERHMPISLFCGCCVFLSTLSLRRATL